MSSLDLQVGHFSTCYFLIFALKQTYCFVFNHVSKLDPSRSPTTTEKPFTTTTMRTTESSSTPNGRMGVPNSVMNVDDLTIIHYVEKRQDDLQPGGNKKLAGKGEPLSDNCLGSGNEDKSNSATGYYNSSIPNAKDPNQRQSGRGFGRVMHPNMLQP